MRSTISQCIVCASVFQSHVTLCACVCISVSGNTSLIRSGVCSVPVGAAAETTGLPQNETNLFSMLFSPAQRCLFAVHKVK